HRVNGQVEIRVAVIRPRDGHVLRRGIVYPPQANRTSDRGAAVNLTGRKSHTVCGGEDGLDGGCRIRAAVVVIKHHGASGDVGRARASQRRVPGVGAVELKGAAVDIGVAGVSVAAAQDPVARAALGDGEFAGGRIDKAAGDRVIPGV